MPVYLSIFSIRSVIICYNLSIKSIIICQKLNFLLSANFADQHTEHLIENIQVARRGVIGVLELD